MNNNQIDIFKNQATTFEDIINTDTIYVHNNMFHIDDVLCCAMVIKLQKMVKGKEYGLGGEKMINIIRDRDNVPLDTKAIIADILGGYFDHHNPDVKNYRGNENGDENKRMASMGCLMEVIGRELFKDNFEKVDEIIQGFDLADLGISREYISGNLGKMNDCRNAETLKKSFEDALGFCYEMIEALQSDKIYSHNYTSYIDNLISELPDEKSNLYNKLRAEIVNEDSSLNYILNRLDDNKSKAFLDKLIRNEEFDYQNRINASKSVENVLKNFDKNQEIIVFDTYPGDVDLSDTNVKYIIFPETGSSNYSISAVSENILMSKEGSFPPSRLRFPTEIGDDKVPILKGKILPIRDEFGISRNIGFEDLRTSDDILKACLDNASSKEEKDIIIDKFNNRTGAFENLEGKVALINEFLDNDLVFIHPMGFFAQTKSKESAINFCRQILNNDVYKEFRDDYRKSVEEIRISEASINAANLIIKLDNECFSKDILDAIKPIAEKSFLEQDINIQKDLKDILDLITKFKEDGSPLFSIEKINLITNAINENIPLDTIKAVSIKSSIDDSFDTDKIKLVLNKEKSYETKEEITKIEEIVKE